MLGAWIQSKYLKQKDLKVKYSSNQPFPHTVLRDFFNPQKIEWVRSALLKEKFVRKESDLFSFYQTRLDSSSSKNPVLKEFHSFFSSKEFLSFISKVTNTRVSSIDMSGFCYGNADHLLSHDDRLEGRKIAYVVNLTKDFTEKDGGKLSLFETKNNTPTKIVKSYLPTFNTLFLFTVSKKSFHQVDEVLSPKPRLSFGGWFHG